MGLIPQENWLSFYQGMQVLETHYDPRLEIYTIDVEDHSGNMRRVDIGAEAMLELVREEEALPQRPPLKLNDQGVIDYLATIAREAV